jgi:hypothetical protein
MPTKAEAAATPPVVFRKVRREEEGRGFMGIPWIAECGRKVNGYR